MKFFYQKTNAGKAILMNRTKKEVIFSLFWKLLERGGTQISQLIIMIILARILLPAQFGIVALLLVFVNLARVFIQSGISVSLIQKKDTDDLDYSSMFALSIALSIVLYIAIFLLSPFIAQFNNIQDFDKMLRVLAIILFFGSYSSIKQAYLVKQMLFRTIFTVSLIATIFSGIFGVFLALNNFGVWSLIINQIMYEIIQTIVLGISVKWQPGLKVSLFRLKNLVRYGWKILISNLINLAYHDTRTILINHRFSTSKLAYYDRGKSIPEMVITNVNGSIQSVLLPVLSSYQDNLYLLKEKMRISIKISSFLVMPMMFGIVIIAEPLVLLLLSDKWLPSVIYMQLLAFSFALYPIHTANLQAIAAIGRSDIYLKLEIVKGVSSITVLLISSIYGLVGIAVGAIISSLLSSFINSYPNSRIINYSYIDQIKDILPTVIAAIIMSIFVYPISFFIKSNMLLIGVQVIFGVLLYTMVTFLVNNSTLKYIFQSLKELKKIKSFEKGE